MITVRSACHAWKARPGKIMSTALPATPQKSAVPVMTILKTKFVNPFASPRLSVAQCTETSGL